MTRVCIPTNPDIYDGYGLRLEIHDWLHENIGACASDMTDFVWGKGAEYFLRVSDSKIDPRYLFTGDRQTAGKFIHFFFKDPKKAVLFKLRWGGM